MTERPCALLVRNRARARASRRASISPAFWARATARWKAAYESPETSALVDSDRQASKALGLNSTPTLYIGGTRYTGPLSVEGIRAAIAAATP